MPHIFQDEIKKKPEDRFISGFEKFDTLYQLYDALGEDASFTTICVIPDERGDMRAAADCIRDASARYNVGNWVVRCANKAEEGEHPTSRTFMGALSAANFNSMMEYCKSRLGERYGLVIHEVPSSKYASNRFDYAYSFGIWFEEGHPGIEIYPTAECQPVKDGSLSPLYLVRPNDRNRPKVSTNYETGIDLMKYRLKLISHWNKVCEREVAPGTTLYETYTGLKSLFKHLLETRHPLFNLEEAEGIIYDTIDRLMKMAVAFAGHSKRTARNLDNMVVHGSVLMNPPGKIIVWDASSPNRWKHYADEAKSRLFLSDLWRDMAANQYGG